MVKRIFITLDDHEYAELVKAKGDKTWKQFVFELLSFKRRTEKESESLPKESLKDIYVIQAKALSKTGELMIKKEGDFVVDNTYYMGSLLPLLVAGEEIDEERVIDLYIFMTNLIFNYLSKKHERNEVLGFIFEYIRVATVRALKGDITSSSRLLNEMCENLRKLPHPY